MTAIRLMLKKCHETISFSRKPQTEFQYTSIGNAAIIQIIANCIRYCRLLLAKWNRVKHYIRLTCLACCYSDLAVLIFDFMRRS